MRNFLEPIHIPPGEAGEKLIDWLCKIFNTTREEAIARPTLYKLGPVTPKPFKKIPVGKIFFIEFDKESNDH